MLLIQKLQKRFSRIYNRVQHHDHLLNYFAKITISYFPAVSSVLECLPVLEWGARRLSDTFQSHGTIEQGLDSRTTKRKSDECTPIQVETSKGCLYPRSKVELGINRLSGGLQLSLSIQFLKLGQGDPRLLVLPGTRQKETHSRKRDN